MYIPDEKGVPRYLFSIRYDISGFIMGERSLRTLMSADSDSGQAADIRVNTVQGLLDSLISQAVEHMGKPVELMSKEDKADAIGYLNEKGAFLITKSGDKVAEYFGISKYTLYHYIDLKNRSRTD